ncbi:hypothetical protein [Streptosporangium sp. NPDC000396]|uniref:hypothetical protein n=1 Tax=Streptosporangium sp. NPDC000396 TaxID=3366185 RepID=UPI00369822DC
MPRPGGWVSSEVGSEDGSDPVGLCDGAGVAEGALVGDALGFRGRAGEGDTWNEEDVVGRGVRRASGAGLCRAGTVVASTVGVGFADFEGLVVVVAGTGREGVSPGQPTTDSGVPVNNPPTTVTTDTSTNVPTTIPVIFRSCLRLPV